MEKKLLGSTGGFQASSKRAVIPRRPGFAYMHARKKDEYKENLRRNEVLVREDTSLPTFVLQPCQ